MMRAVETQALTGITAHGGGVWWHSLIVLGIVLTSYGIYRFATRDR